MSEFLKLFNSLQITALFSIAPFLLNWAATAEFTGHGAIFWIGCIVYFIYFILMTASVFAAIDKR